MQKKSQYKTLIVVFAFLIAALIALAAVLYRVLDGKAYYYTLAVLIVLCAMIPFFVSFEKHLPSARELSALAVMTALAVASRAAFYALPTLKPMCAIVIITAAGFGAFPGFICGAVSAFVSNFIFGQGVWTPFQMLAMGTVGLIAGLIFCDKKIAKSRIALAIIGAVLAFAVYGLIVDISSVLLMVTEFTPKQILSVYASGVPFSLSHAAMTGAVLLLAGKPFIEKLERMRIKYGIFGGLQ